MKTKNLDLSYANKEQRRLLENFKDKNYGQPFDESGQRIQPTSSSLRGAWDIA